MCPLSASPCLSRLAAPSAGASLSTGDQCWPGRLLAQGDFPWDPGGSRGARQPRWELTMSTGLQGATGVGRAEGFRTQFAFPGLAGAGSAAWRRVGMAGRRPRCGRGLPAGRVRPGGSRGLGLLPGAAASALLSPARTHPGPGGGQMVGWCGDSQCLLGHHCGCGAGVSVHLCVSVCH